MRSLLAIIALLLCPAGLSAAVAEQDRCYDWTEAAPIVRREKLASAKDVHQQAREKLEGELIRITLCEEKGQFVYKLVVQQGSGRFRYFTVDARAPF